jgi:RNA polymerase sigma-70 factor (ECF subfamily)
MRELGGSARGVSSDAVSMPDEASALFEDFFEVERVRLYRASFALTGSRQEAEDISQEAFLRVWERWDRVSAMDDPSGYLYRIAMNVFLDRRRRVLLGMKRAIGLTPSPDDYEAVEARSVAATVLGSLTPRQRAAVVLTDGLGYRAEEAGTLLGIKGATVRSLLSKARSALRDTIEEER